MDELTISEKVMTSDGYRGTVVEFDNQGTRTVCVRLDNGPQVWFRPKDLSKLN